MQHQNNLFNSKNQLYLDEQSSLRSYFRLLWKIVNKVFLRFFLRKTAKRSQISTERRNSNDRAANPCLTIPRSGPERKSAFSRNPI
jgi:hypothetical protein